MAFTSIGAYLEKSGAVYSGGILIGVGIAFNALAWLVDVANEE